MAEPRSTAAVGGHSAALAEEHRAVDLEAKAQALADTEEKVRELGKNSS